MNAQDLDSLHELLTDLAGEATPSPGYPQKVHRRAVQFKRRRLALFSAVAVTLLAATSTPAIVAIVAMGIFRTDAPNSTAVVAAAPLGGAELGWATAGNSTDPALVKRAVQAWDTQADNRSHTGIHVLLADDQTALGPVIILEGRDADQKPRIAFLTGSVGDTGELILRADRASDDFRDKRTISLVSARMGIDGRTSPTAWGIALAVPGATDVHISSTAVDDERFDDSEARRSRYIIAPLPLSAAPWNSTVAALVGSQVVRETVQGGTPADPVALPAAIIGLDDNTATATLSQPSDRVSLGQWVTMPQGLVGRVSAVRDRTVSIERVTAASFTTGARTSITNYEGTFRGGARTGILTGLPGTAAVQTGNRVEVVDPVEKDSAVGAVTVGRVAASDANSYRVTLSAVPEQGSTVYILTPSIQPRAS